MNEDRSTFEIIATSIGVIAIVMVIIPAALVISGFFLATIWNLIVPKVFVSAPFLSVPQAIGISIVAGMLKGYEYKKDTRSSKEKTVATLTSVMAIWIIPLIIALLLQPFL